MLLTASSQEVFSLVSLIILNALVPILSVLILGYLAGRLKRVDIARATILWSAAPSGLFGILFRLRYSVQSQVTGSTLIASGVRSALPPPPPFI